MTRFEELWAEVAEHFGAQLKNGMVVWIRNGVQHSLRVDNSLRVWNKGVTSSGLVIYRYEWPNLTTIRPAVEPHAVILVLETDGLQTEVTIRKDGPPVFSETTRVRPSQKAIV